MNGSFQSRGAVSQKSSFGVPKKNVSTTYSTQVQGLEQNICWGKILQTSLSYVGRFVVNEQGLSKKKNTINVIH